MIKIEQVDVILERNTALENHVLRDINLTINNGEFVTILSTRTSETESFLNMLAGDILPENGYILIDGRDVTRLPTWRRADMIARIFKDPTRGLCDDLSIEENLAIAWCRGRKRRLYSALTPALYHRVQDLLDSFDLNLENQLTDVVSQLSVGQRQIINVVMASMQPSNVLLLDDPTAALDPSTSQRFLTLINELVTTNKQTTLMTTHSLKEALSYGNRIIMLHDGRILFDVAGEKRAKLTLPQLLKLYEKKRAEPFTFDHLFLD